MTALNGAMNHFDDTDTVEVDVVIVGSGCGGGVMAEQLVTAGYKVLVVEKGGYYQPHEFARWRECEAMAKMYDKGGLCTSEDGSVIVLSGSCIGGGSTVNWLASFRTPEHVLNEWAATGLTAFGPNGEFHESMEFALERFHVNTDNTFYHEEEANDPKNSFAMNENNRNLWKGSANCGLKPEKIPRNAKKCVNCGSCCFGCSHKSKQSTMNAILEPILLAQYKKEFNNHLALKNGGRLYVIPNCKIDRVTTDVIGKTGRKFATGVEGIVKIYEPELGPTLKPTLLATRHLKVNAKITVSSCGAIYTPALLLASGFTHPKIGKHLTLHPVLGCGGIYGKDVQTQLASGVSMGVVVKPPRDITGPMAHNPVSLNYLSADDIQNAITHGVAIETPPVHLGIFGLLTPWNSGLEFKVMSTGHQNTSVFIGISRDHAIENNCITLDSENGPVIHYSISKQDEKMLLIGLERQIRILAKTGVRYIFLSHANFPWFYVNEDGEKSLEERLNEFIDSIWKEGVQSHRMNVFSAHQMSSCRMAATIHDGPTSMTGELYECENMFIADASVFPTSLGINPMMTIDAFSHMISKNVIKKLENIQNRMSFNSSSKKGNSLAMKPNTPIPSDRDD